MKMKILSTIILISFSLSCQTSKKEILQSKKEPSESSEKIYQDTPNALLDFNALIGDCNCKSILRDQTGKWKDTINLKWTWKYIMDGNGVYDEGWYESKGKKHHFSSLRVYDTVNKHWYVSYFTPNLTSIPETWVGGKIKGDIVLKKQQKNAQGKKESVLTFFDITTKGFSWEGKIVNEEKNINFSFWKIWCVKEN